MLLVFDPMLAIIMILVLTLIYSILYMAIRKKITQMGAESTTLIGMRYRVVFEAISGIKDVIMKNISGEMLKRYSEPSLKYAKYSAYGNALSELPRYALEIIIFGGMVMLTVSLLMNEQDSSFIAVLSLYAMAGYRLMPSAQLIFRAFSTIRYNTPVLEKIINELNDKYVLIENEVEAADGVQFRDEIKLDKIEYTYPGSRDKVLNNLSIEIKSRSAIGIAGVSGAGKTTLIDILLGLISPDKGSLKVDGVEITASNICAWRKSIGYVPQDVFVADDTIANNIAFGIPSNEIVESNIEFSASLSNLDSFIASLAEGYETIIGERGSKMSGGQRQRLGIARALYSNPDIIVFDEATSALDGITESEIIDSLHNLRHKKTIVMIAHRLTTLKECDIIYFLKDGVVSDSGTYQELMEHNSLFKDMSGS